MEREEERAKSRSLGSTICGYRRKRRTRERHVENESEKLQGVVSTGKAEKRSEEGWPTVPSAILPKGKKIKKQ